MNAYTGIDLERRTPHRAGQPNAPGSQFTGLRMSDDEVRAQVTGLVQPGYCLGCGEEAIFHLAEAPVCDWCAYILYDESQGRKPIREEFLMGLNPEFNPDQRRLEEMKQKARDYHVGVLITGGVTEAEARTMVRRSTLADLIRRQSSD